MKLQITDYRCHCEAKPKQSHYKRFLATLGMTIYVICNLQFAICNYVYSQDVNQLVAEGNKLIKEKKYDEAIKMLLEAKKSDEKSPLPDVALGMMFLRRDSLWEAETHLKSAEKLDPELCGIQYTLALLYEKKGENEKAILYWNKLSKNPDFKNIAKKHLQFLGGAK